MKRATKWVMEIGTRHVGYRLWTLTQQVQLSECRVVHQLQGATLLMKRFSGIAYYNMVSHNIRHLYPQKSHSSYK